MTVVCSMSVSRAVVRRRTRLFAARVELLLQRLADCNEAVLGSSVCSSRSMNGCRGSDVWAGCMGGGYSSEELACPLGRDGDFTREIKRTAVVVYIGLYLFDDDRLVV